MADAQHELGFSFFDYVPVLFTHEVNYVMEALKLLGPTILLLGGLYAVQSLVKSSAGGMMNPGKSKAKVRASCARTRLACD